MATDEQKGQLMLLNGLLCRGDDLQRRFNNLDQQKLMDYRVRSADDWDSIVGPWKRLADDTIDWLAEISARLPYLDARDSMRDGWYFNKRDINSLLSVGAGGGASGRCLRTIRHETRMAMAMLIQIKESIDADEISRVAAAVRHANAAPRNTAVITSVVVVRSKTNEYLLVVNDDYATPLRGDRAKSKWGALYDIATIGSFEGRNIKSLTASINSDRKSAMYSRTDYLPTHIVRQSGDRLIAAPGVAITAIDRRTFTRRQRQQ